MSYYRKYRSQKFGDLIGEDHVRDTLLQASKSNEIAHAYLFTGPRGTGKTSTARLIAKAVNCLDLGKDGEPCGKCDSCTTIVDGRAIDVVEIDAASNRGIDEIRALRENVKFAPTTLKKKVYIIDEVHMLTREAFNALLKTLEEPPLHLIFILATTEAHKVPVTVVSRTQRFDFHRITKKNIIKNLKVIAKAENIEIDDKSLDVISAMAEGGHRDAITLLEQAAAFSKKIDINQVENILGLMKSGEIGEYLGAIFNSQTEEGLKIAHRFHEQGLSLNQMVVTTVEWLRKILLYLVADEITFDETQENIEIIKKLAENIKKNNQPDKIVVAMIEIFLEAGRMFKDATYAVLPIEMATIKASALIELKTNNSKVITTTQNSSTEEPIEENPKSKIQSSNETQNPNDQKLNPNEANPAPKGPLSEGASQASEAETASVEVLEMSDELWQAVVLETKKSNTSLAALLRDSRPIVIENDLMTLGVKFKFHNDKISEIKNLAVLEEAIARVMGKKIRIKCQVTDLKKKPKEKLSDDALSSAVEEIFA
jgi:DNA polymerase-3 subunit gamma/tau